MHKPLDRAPGIVADRVVALGRVAKELSRVRHELKRDRIGGTARLDEIGQRRCEPDRIMPGHGLKLLKALWPGKPRFDEIRGAGQAAGFES